MCIKHNTLKFLKVSEILFNLKRKKSSKITQERKSLIYLYFSIFPPHSSSLPFYSQLFFFVNYLTFIHLKKKKICPPQFRYINFNMNKKNNIQIYYFSFGYSSFGYVLREDFINFFFS